MQNRFSKLVVACTALVAFNVLAQEDPDPPIETLELTMELMPEGATQPDAITRVIELPAAVAEAARENASRGLAEANAARERREAGLTIAAEARERSSEQAQQDRENAGRGPPDRGDIPGAPDVPGNPPGDPPGRGGPPNGSGPPGN
jgi:hypothetical protein